MGFDWTKYITKVPMVVSGITGIIHMVKGASKEDKVDAIRSAVMTSVSLAEFATDKDLLKDEQIAKLLNALVDAELAAAHARDALKAGLLAAKEAVNK